MKPENLHFNRYGNILPNEGTRVKLTTQPSDYINAKFAFFSFLTKKNEIQKIFQKLGFFSYFEHKNLENTQKL